MIPPRACERIISPRLPADAERLQKKEDRPDFSEVPQSVWAGHSRNNQTDTEVKTYEYRRLYCNRRHQFNFGELRFHGFHIF